MARLIRNDTTPNSGVDLNDYVTPGIYAVTEPTNGPDTGDFIVEVYESEPSILQRATKLDDGVVELRVYNGMSWGAWEVVSGGAGGGEGDTNLSISNRTDTTLVVASSTGDDATVPAATTSLAGLMIAADKAKSDIIGSFTVRAATTANINISSEINNGDTIDGVVLATNDLVLVKHQLDAEDNGIYVVSGSPTRHTAFATFNAHVGRDFRVQEGSVGGGHLYRCTSAPGGVLDTDPLAFAIAGGANLAVANRTTTTLDITSDTGTDATIPVASTTEAGLLSSLNAAKLQAVVGFAVRAASTANITIATALNDGDVLDGVTLADGERVLVKNQNAPAENGVYVVGAVPARHPAFDTYNEHAGRLVSVQEGSTQADSLWLCTSDNGGTLDTTALTFVRDHYFSSMSGGLSLVNGQLRNAESFMFAVSDETTALTTGTAKLTFRMPYAFTLTDVRSSINTVSSSGLVTVDINEGGNTILSTKLSIDQGEKTSVTADTPRVISDTALADDAEITIDIDAAGTGAKGLKVILIGYRP